MEEDLPPRKSQAGLRTMVQINPNDPVDVRITIELLDHLRYCRPHPFAVRHEDTIQLGGQLEPWTVGMCAGPFDRHIGYMRDVERNVADGDAPMVEKQCNFNCVKSIRLVLERR
jgi:hypothetical protein